MKHAALIRLNSLYLLVAAANCHCASAAGRYPLELLVAVAETKWLLSVRHGRIAVDFYDIGLSHLS